MAKTCGQCRWYRPYMPWEMGVRRENARKFETVTDGWCAGACKYQGDDVDSGNEYAPAHCGGFTPRKEK